MVYRCRHCGDDICDGDLYAPNDGDPLCSECAWSLTDSGGDGSLSRASADNARIDARDRAADMERRRRNEN